MRNRLGSAGLANQFCRPKPSENRGRQIPYPFTGLVGIKSNGVIVAPPPPISPAIPAKAGIQTISDKIAAPKSSENRER